MPVLTQKQTQQKITLFFIYQLLLECRARLANLQREVEEIKKKLEEGKK